MKPTIRRPIASRSAVGAAFAALLVGAAGGAVLLPAAAIAAPPAPKYSPAFIAAVQPAQKAIEAAKTNPAVQAGAAKVQAAQNAYDNAQGKAARDAARAQVDAAEAEVMVALDPTVKLLDAARAAATTPDDKYAAAQLAVGLGGVAHSTALQRRGVLGMIDSGKAPPDQLPKFQFFAGQFAMQSRDFPAAQAAFTAAIQGGYHDNDVDALLAEAYFGNNQMAQGLTTLQAAIDRTKAAGQPVPENWYRRGLGVAYNAHLLDKAAVFADGLVAAYPSKDNWAGAIDVLRDTGHYPAAEELDLMRLMERTHSFAEAGDYLEFVQAADARRYPGEVKTVLDEGFASGKLTAANAGASEARATASARIAADRASLPGLERDARAPSANVATATGAADAFLSYGQTATAIALYQIALAKPGADANLINTRLGIAQVDAGDTAGAQASFAKVAGPRQPLAQLWTIYAQQKAAGKA